MAQNKREEFLADQTAIAEFAKALAHPARIAILQAISEREGCICGEIVELLPLAQSTVSQHLKVLKEAGLIKGEVEGPKSCYCIDWEKMSNCKLMFAQMLDGWKKPEGGECC